MDRYDVYVLGFSGGRPEDGLMRVFGLSAEIAARLVENAPCPVKRDLDAEAAQRYRDALRSIGARVDVRPAGDPLPGASAPPEAPKPSAQVFSRPNSDDLPGGAALGAATADFDSSATTIDLEGPPALRSPAIDVFDGEVSHGGGYAFSYHGGDDGPSISLGDERPPSPFEDTLPLPSLDDDPPGPFGGAKPASLGSGIELEPLALEPVGLTAAKRPAAALAEPAATATSHPLPEAPPDAVPPSRTATAAWSCERCKRSFTDAEALSAEMRRPIGEPARLCPVCRHGLQPTGVESHDPFPVALVKSFAYPFQREGMPILIGVGLVAGLVSYLPLIGGIISGGIVLGYMFSVITHTAAGADDLPTPGDFTEMSDFIAPIARYIFAFAQAFLPAFLVTVAIDWSSAAFLPAVIAATLAGIFLLPALIILAAHTTGCMPPNPVTAIQLIGRIPVAYLMTSFTVGVTYGGYIVALGVIAAIDEAVPIPILPSVIGSIVSIILPVIGCRQLGLLIHHHQHELGLD